MSEKTKKQYQEWLKNIRRKFYRLCHELKIERRRNKENRRVRFFSDIVENLTQLLLNIDQYSPIIQKRLIMIDKNFVQLTNLT